MADDRLYDVARILKLPPDWPTLLARIQELQDTKVKEVRSVAMTDQQVWTLLVAAGRLVRDETFSTDQEIAAALRISLKTWRRLSGPGGDQELRKLGHLELGGGGRTARRYRLADVLERLRRELAECGAPPGHVYCDEDGCLEQIPRPPGSGLALCPAHQPKDRPLRRPAGVLGLQLTGQHLGGAPGAPTGTWSELGASWARWYLQHTPPTDRARQAYDAQGLALYCAERLLQYELDWDELRPEEQSALCQGIEQGLTDAVRPPAATPAQGTLLIEREPTEPAPALCGATAPSGGNQGPRCCRRPRGHTGKHCYVEVPHGQRLEEVVQTSA